MDNRNRGWFFVLLVAIACLVSVVRADRPGWDQRDVDWLAGPGGRITSVGYPRGGALPLLVGPRDRESAAARRTAPAAGPSASIGLFSVESAVLSNQANVIESPPIAGFVPWIAVAVTDRRGDDSDWVAQAHTSVVGQPLTGNPETDFAIGLFDTGASTHLMSYAAAQRTGVYAADLLTTNTVEIIGATNSTFALVSQPLALFMDGLAAIDANTMTLDDSNMVGQSNVSVVVGDVPPPDMKDLPTAIGSPMSVNFVAAIHNDRPVTVTYDGNDYTSPDIRFYEHGDPDIPGFSSTIPLNLIPSGAMNIQYIPDLEAILEFIFQPGQPSIIVGNLGQSLFFAESVDLRHKAQSAVDKDRFMLDTGAQITVISSGIASRLGLDPANADFEVDIEDATGTITIQPGFYIDSLEIPALGEWLSYTNVPVVLLDVASPEGGTLDGIIGMNLFVGFNLVLRGGGMLGQDPPSLAFERIPAPLAADIAPPEGDGVVDWLDFAAFAQAWLSSSGLPNWNASADLAPPGASDGVVDWLDLAVFAESWLEGAAR
ncbi:MAG: aspartyl protease family protein [Phycisphaerales bacterium]|nr:MAG: aspartyl protease family protein [Phycisphaerales bacterium]